MGKRKSLSLPVQSTPKNPNAAPAIKEPQKTTVSRERDAPGGRHVAEHLPAMSADAIRDDEQAERQQQPEQGGRADARQDIPTQGRRDAIRKPRPRTSSGERRWKRQRPSLTLDMMRGRHVAGDGRARA